MTKTSHSLSVYSSHVAKLFLFLLTLGQIQCISSDIYEVRVLVSGLDGTLVLQNNDADDLTIQNNGPFRFSDKLASGDDYRVTVLTQPEGQVCSIDDGEGQIGNTDSEYVEVLCVDGFTVGGTISGQTGEVKLTNNGSDEITVSETAETFTFTTALSDGDTYQIVVSEKPSGQSCAVTGGGDGNGGGTIDNAHDTSVIVTCTTDAVSTNRIIFITPGTFTASQIGGISGADALCTTAATGLGYSGTYKAFLVDGTNRRACSTSDCGGGISENLDWVLQPNTTYYRSNRIGIIGTTTSSAIFTFPVTNGITGVGGSTTYWSGMSADWINGVDCATWLNNGANGIYGTSDATSTMLIFNTTSICSTPRNLACAQQ